MLVRPVESVAVVNRSDLPDRDVSLMVVAARDHLIGFCDAWQLPAPGIAVYTAAHEQKPDEEAALLFVDSAGDPGALGYHTVMGFTRYGYIDLGQCTAYGEPPSRVFFHELFELLADPDCDGWRGPYQDGTLVALEVCDPCQASSRTTHVSDPLYGEGDVEISAYVLPPWFEPGVTGPYDSMGVCPGPLQVAGGGYVVRTRNGVVVSEGAARVKAFGRTFRRLMSGKR